MKRSITLLLTLLSFSIHAQYKEVGIVFGTSNYLGDLSEQRLATEGFGGMIGVFGRYNATEYLSLKASLTKGTISGSDEFAKQEANRHRNLHFRSDLLELSVTSEVNFQPFNIRANQTGVPYFFTGAAITHFNPQAQMRGNWYDLQPQMTEGNKYSRYAVAVPFGLGMKFNLTYKLNFGLEIGARKLFTDYLDDVSTEYIDIIDLRASDPTRAALAYRTPELTGSFGEDPMGTQRGDSGNNDWYFFGGITVSVNLTDKYGLDFDPQYEEFKEHLKKPKEEKKKKLGKRKKSSKYQQKRRMRLLRKKEMLKPQVKKQSQ